MLQSARWKRAHTTQPGETDCGPAAVRTVLRRHGISIDLAVLRDSIGLGEAGASLLDIKHTLDQYNVASGLYKVTEPDLHEVIDDVGPIIAFTDDGSGPHYITVHASGPGRTYVISDPRASRPLRVEREQLDAVLLGPTLITQKPATRSRSEKGLPARLTNWSVLREIIVGNRALLIQALALSILVAALTIGLGLFLQISLSRVAIAESMGVMGKLAAAFTVATLAAGALQYIRGRIIISATRSIQIEYSQRYVSKLLSLPSLFMKQRRTGDLVTRLDDIEHLQGTATDATLGAAVDVFVISLVWIYLSLNEPWLSALLIIPGASTVLVSLLLVPRISTAAVEVMQRDATLKSELLTQIQGYDTVVSHGAQDYAKGRIAKVLNKRIDAQVSLSRLSNVNSVVKVLIQGESAVAVGWLVIYSAWSESISVAYVFTYFTLSMSLLNSLESILSLQVVVQQVSTAIGRYRDIILQRVQSCPDARGDDGSALNGPLGLCAEGLSFRFPTAGKLSIADISLTVRPGSRVQIKGANGAGKTTILKLLSGLLDATGGTIDVTDSNGNKSPLSVNRARVVYLSETPLIVNGSVLENLTLGHTIPEPVIEHACEVAEFTSVLGTLPEGMSTHVRDSDPRFSRGQLQRLAIARALCLTPGIVFFDETFSGIDELNWDRIWRRLRSEEITCVVVAHRESEKIKYDQVFDLDRREIT